jgi:transcriptional regulator with XRE-family HTH domain
MGRRRSPTVGRGVTGADARRAREALGLTQDEAAASFGMTPSVVAGWEDGRIKVPHSVAAMLQWAAAGIERRNALAASGLPTCDWVQAFENEPESDGAKRQAERDARLDAHMKACRVCKARVAYIAERFPPMPRPPVTGWLAIALPIYERIQRLPQWAQPPAIGAAACLAYSLIKLVFLLPRLGGMGVNGLLVVLGGFSASAALGIVGGFVYVAYRRFRRPPLSPDQKGALPTDRRG